MEIQVDIYVLQNGNVFSCQQQLQGKTNAMRRDHDFINIIETECNKVK